MEESLVPEYSESKEELHTLLEIANSDKISTENTFISIEADIKHYDGFLQSLKDEKQIDNQSISCCLENAGNGLLFFRGIFKENLFLKPILIQKDTLVEIPFLIPVHMDHGTQHFNMIFKTKISYNEIEKKLIKVESTSVLYHFTTASSPYPDIRDISILFGFKEDTNGLLLHSINGMLDVDVWNKCMHYISIRYTTSYDPTKKSLMIKQYLTYD